MSDRKGDSQTLSLLFEQQQPKEQLPGMALYGISADGELKKLAAVDAGKLKLDKKWEGAGFVRFALGPDAENQPEPGAKTLMHFHWRDLQTLAVQRQPLIVPEKWWRHWWPFVRCVSGSVRRCFFPFAELPIHAPLLRLQPPFKIQPLLPPAFCLPMCDGIVEVYERICCCKFIDIIPDILIPRITELIPEPLPWPDPLPDPEPFPPGPFPPGPRPLPITRLQTSRATMAPASTPRKLEDLADAHGLGAEQGAMLHRLRQDVAELRKTSAAQMAEFLELRPYLWPLICSCTTKKVGQSSLRPDGQFDVCWPAFLSPLKLHCHRRYAYIIKQWHNGQWLTVYNGLAKHEYFKVDETPVLRSYLGHACHEPPPLDHDKPFMMLDLIGSTRSHRLHSHWLGKNAAGLDLTQPSADALHPLPENGGLCDPSNVDSGSVNRPWAQTLSLSLLYSESLKATGARYYRLSHVPVQDNGQPLPGATPTPLTATISWQRLHFIGGQPEITSDNLGPVSMNVGGQAVTGLYRIPFQSDGHWLGAQPHGLWATDGQNGRSLLYLEVFDAAGNRLNPVNAGFDYLRRIGETGPDSISIIRHERLAHAFWLDNKPVYADIIDLRKNGVPSSQECQFMSGEATALFSTGFAAFHTTRNHVSGPRTFMRDYTLTWYRGLNGASETFDSGDTNAPPSLNPAAPAQSASVSFDYLLSKNASPPHKKCTFAVTLRVYCRHTNGSSRITAFDRQETASFAVEII